MADENYEDDIFDDLYDDEPTSQQAPAASAPAPKAEPEPAPTESASAPPQDATQNHNQNAEASWAAQGAAGEDTQMGQSGFNAGGEQSFDNAPAEDDNYGPINVKEDGKMFIGGLNWETTEDSLKGYFSQFGEVSECTVMRDSATGRSRGFGFLTFKDPKCVNIVMVKEHYLDGKIIDPKRAIPREEQERTSKIFVGGVSQEATEEDFTNFFKQFGRVVDATLMMDKETGRPRGFGFVTFDGDAAVDATLRGPLQILGKQIEVKRAQPRGNMRDDDGGDGNKKFGRGNKINKFNDGGNGGQGGGNGYENGGGNMQAQGSNTAMSPAMMAQYWQRMQQYFQSMQQTLAQQQAGGGMPGNPMGGMGGMNPMQMQQMQQQMMNQGMNRGTGSPNPQMMGGPGGMNPMQMQQMQMQQMQQMQGGGGPGGPGGPGMMNAQGGQNAGPRPAYTAQDQLAFEQQKYEQQQARRQQQLSGPAGYGAAQGGGPASWDGMYDDAPPPNVPSGPSGGRGGGGFRNNRSRQGSSQPPSGGGQAPINAPTGPKNAGVRGANYRGGGHRGGGGFRHQPYGGRGG
ncbi:hypothetical protein COCSADRAFT_160854 [Bipolaris sorokiniana ND90Pr]|uniref:RRM domain-containing protein n=1 Tax=Cochliobolus sativus (strain ND90Pr / ATCC 201652) TaxID=665912 RepID=M2T2L6_COCSN|nr:uncharacterized protein COCSADRAFT_160854 [Bipolaris sorokiniana ND90Pr]EMD63446.1 hypothetical protein COCSADRAFT_160854 [Bipolaris sorokiniana ND90Pr]